PVQSSRPDAVVIFDAVECVATSGEIANDFSVSAEASVLDLLYRQTRAAGLSGAQADDLRAATRALSRLVFLKSDFAHLILPVRGSAALRPVRCRAQWAANCG